MSDWRRTRVILGSKAQRTCLHYSKQDVAITLGIHPASLYRVLKKYHDKRDMRKWTLKELIEFINDYNK